jgi:hypothetical protein
LERDFDDPAFTAVAVLADHVEGCFGIPERKILRGYLLRSNFTVEQEILSRISAVSNCFTLSMAVISPVTEHPGVGRKHFKIRAIAG